VPAKDSLIGSRLCRLSRLDGAAGPGGLRGRLRIQPDGGPEDPNDIAGVELGVLVDVVAGGIPWPDRFEASEQPLHDRGVAHIQTLVGVVIAHHPAHEDRGRSIPRRTALGDRVAGGFRNVQQAERQRRVQAARHAPCPERHHRQVLGAGRHRQGGQRERGAHHAGNLGVDLVESRVDRRHPLEHRCFQEVRVVTQLEVGAAHIAVAGQLNGHLQTRAFLPRFRVHHRQEPGRDPLDHHLGHAFIARDIEGVDPDLVLPEHQVQVLDQEPAVGEWQRSEGLTVVFPANWTQTQVVRHLAGQDERLQLRAPRNGALDRDLRRRNVHKHRRDLLRFLDQHRHFRIRPRRRALPVGERESGVSHRRERHDLARPILGRLGIAQHTATRRGFNRQRIARQRALAVAARRMDPLDLECGQRPAIKAQFIHHALEETAVESITSAVAQLPADEIIAGRHHRRLVRNILSRQDTVDEDAERRPVPSPRHMAELADRQFHARLHLGREERIHRETEYRGVLHSLRRHPTL
jgi:hypothetical protein